MGIQPLISQGLLALLGLGALLVGRFAEHRLMLALAALLMSLLCSLLSPRKWALLPQAAYVGLCVYDPELLSFLPLMGYQWLMLPDVSAAAVVLLLPLLWHWQQVHWVTAAGVLLAVLLWYKDKELGSARERYFTAADELRHRSDSQQREVLAMQREQETGIKLAIARERNRIARDIHDNVGHILSRGILQVGALALGTADPESKQSLEALQQSLRAGMDTVRNSVHNTRQDTLALDIEIEALLSQFDFCPVRYHNSAVTELSLSNKYVVMAIIREALNNIMRHSNATQANVTLSEMDHSHLLLISDNGTAQASSGTGMGLAAMEERVRGLRGSMHISRGHGFRILITLPKEDRI